MFVIHTKIFGENVHFCMKRENHLIIITGSVMIKTISYGLLFREKHGSVFGGHITFGS